MESFPVTMRQAIPCDEKHLLEFTKADGWDYSEFDVKSVMSIDPDFLIVAVDCSNTPVGKLYYCFFNVDRYTMIICFLHKY